MKCIAIIPARYAATRFPAKLLARLGGKPVIERVCYLIAHHHTYSGIDGMDYQILLEADFLVNAWESSMSTEQIQSACEHIFQTETGRTLLNDLFLLP